MAVFPSGYPSKAQAADDDSVLIADSADSNKIKGVPASQIVPPKGAGLSQLNGGTTAGLLKTDASGNVSSGQATADNIDLTTLSTFPKIWAGIHDFGSGTGEKHITGFGFTPRLILVMGGVYSTGVQARHSSGMAVKNSDETITQTANASYASQAGTAKSASSSSSAFIANDGSSSTLVFSGAVTAMNDDDITVNISISGSSSQYSIVVIGY